MTNEFIKGWLEAWNAHDLHRILAHYSNEVILESPLALERMPHSRGRLCGKEQIKAYWALGLHKHPNLTFQIEEVLLGVDTISIYYLALHTHKKVIETMSFDTHMKVHRVIVTYSESPSLDHQVPTTSKNPNHES